MAGARKSASRSSKPRERAAATVTALVDPGLARKRQRLSKSLGAVATAAVKRPGATIKGLAATGGALLSALRGRSTLVPAAGDRRFEDAAFRDSPLYRRLMQSYLALSSGSQRWADGLDLDPRDAARAKMVLGMVGDTLAPTNTLLGNPAALKRTLETGGGNLAKGIKQMLRDMRSGNGLPSSVDRAQFKVGGNLALTPGAVVYRDEVLELIQYTPQTAKVHGTPVFVVPPQINKYYVWDLAPGRSLVEFLVKQGHQVFVVSWFDPGEAQGDWGLATYVRALERAMGVSREIADAKQLHVIGACSGGITAAALLAYLAAKRLNWARSLGLLVAVLDIDGIADSSMGLFANLETLELARSVTGAQGRARGPRPGAGVRLAAAQRADLELLGQQLPARPEAAGVRPAVLELGHHAPAGAAACRLHRALETNAFTVPGGLRIEGHALDLGKVRCDAYILGGTTDHITPWEGCYRTRGLLGGRSDFVLSSSGHVQSIVNPLGNRKAAYAVHTGAHATPEVFKAGAVQHEGSWWPHLSGWLDRALDSGPKSARETRIPPLQGAGGGARNVCASGAVAPRQSAETAAARDVPGLPASDSLSPADRLRAAGRCQQQRLAAARAAAGCHPRHQCSFTRGTVRRKMKRAAVPSAVFHAPCKASSCIL